MRYMFLASVMLATACDSSGPLGSGSSDPGDEPGIEDPGSPGSSTYPYEGSDAAFIKVVATLNGVEIDDCQPVLYDLDVFQAKEACGEPIAVAPDVALMVTVGDLEDRCGNWCFTTNQYGGGWNDLPLQGLDDGGKAIGVPQVITPLAGETVTVTVPVNQYVTDRWTCEFSPIDYVETGDAVFEGTGQVLMPGLGELLTDGRQIEALPGYDLSGQGSFQDSYTMHFEGHSLGVGSDIVVDCTDDE